MAKVKKTKNNSPDLTKEFEQLEKDLYQLGQMEKSVLSQTLNKTKKSTYKRITSLLNEKLFEEGLEKYQLVKKSSLGSLFKIGLALSTIAGLYFIYSVYFFGGQSPLLKNIFPAASYDIALNKEGQTSNGLNPEQSSFTIVSQQPFEKLTVKNKIEVEPEFKYSTSISSDGKSVSIIPQETLQYDTQYTIRLKQGTLFSNRSSLDQNLEWSFTTLPEFKVKSTEPINQSFNQAVDTPISLEFTYSDIDLNSVKQNVTITPRVTGSYQIRNKKVIFTPQNQFDPNTWYTVTINDSLSRTNQEQINQGAGFKFKTGSLDSKGYPYINPYIAFDNDLSSVNLNPLIQFSQVANITSSLNLDVYSLALDQLISLVPEIIKYGQIINNPLTGQDPLVEKTLTSPLADQNINLDISKTGFYLIKINSNQLNYPRYHILNYSDLDLYAAWNDQERLNVWGSDISNQTFLDKANVNIYTCNSTNCSLSISDRTDEEGLLITKAEYQPLLIELNQNNQSAIMLDLEPTYPYIKLTTDKDKYAKGQELHFFINLLNRDSDVEVLKVLAFSQTGEILYQQNFNNDLDLDNLNVNGSFLLPTETLGNKVNLVVYDQNQKILIKKNIATTNTPNLIVQAQVLPYQTKNNQTLYISGQVVNQNSLPVNGQNLTIDLNQRPIEQNLYTNQDYFQANITQTKSLIKSYQVQTDQQGAFQLQHQLNLNTDALLNQILIEIKDGNTALHKLSSTVAQANSYIKIEPEKMNLTSGDEVVLNITSQNLFNLNNKPATKFDLKIKRVNITKTQTGTTYDPDTKQIRPVYAYSETPTVVSDWQSITTNDQAKSSLTLSNLSQGTYYASIRPNGDQSSQYDIATPLFYVDPDFSTSYEKEINTTIYPVPNQPRYKPGQTIKVKAWSDDNTIKAPFFLLDQTNQQILDQQYLDLSASTSVEFPVDKDYPADLAICSLYPTKNKTYTNSQINYTNHELDLFCYSVDIYQSTSTFNYNLEVDNSNQESLTVNLTVKDGQNQASDLPTLANIFNPTDTNNLQDLSSSTNIFSNHIPLDYNGQGQIELAKRQLPPYLILNLSSFFENQSPYQSTHLISTNQELVVNSLSPTTLVNQQDNQIEYSLANSSSNQYKIKADLNCSDCTYTKTEQTATVNPYSWLTNSLTLKPNLDNFKILFDPYMLVSLQLSDLDSQPILEEQYQLKVKPSSANLSANLKTTFLEKEQNILSFDISESDQNVKLQLSNIFYQPLIQDYNQSSNPVQLTGYLLYLTLVNQFDEYLIADSTLTPQDIDTINEILKELASWQNIDGGFPLKSQSTSYYELSSYIALTLAELDKINGLVEKDTINRSALISFLKNQFISSKEIYQKTLIMLALSRLDQSDLFPDFQQFIEANQEKIKLSPHLNIYTMLTLDQLNSNGDKYQLAKALMNKARLEEDYAFWQEDQAPYYFKQTAQSLTSLGLWALDQYQNDKYMKELIEKGYKYIQQPFVTTVQISPIVQVLPFYSFSQLNSQTEINAKTKIQLYLEQEKIFDDYITSLQTIDLPLTTLQTGENRLRIEKDNQNTTYLNIIKVNSASP